ncbi:MAG: hypothetical protein CL613_00730 [Aquimarina sp.]|nr:hypothetical protein [Aquimarina sp.]
MKRYILGAILFTAVQTSFAQGYLSGKLYLKDGSTKTGFIQNKDNIDSETINFKSNINDKETSFTANQIEYYNFETINRQVVSEKIDDRIYFLEVIIRGKSNLLFLTSREGKKRYFLKSEKSGLKELKETQKSNGSSVFTLKEYVGILNLDFNDCPDIGRKIEITKLQLRSLAKTFEDYNNCVGTTDLISERLTRKAIHNITFNLGYGTSTIIAKGETKRGEDFSNSSKPIFGLDYTYLPTLFGSHLGLTFGFNLYEIDSEASYMRPIGEFRNYEKVHISTSNLNINMGFVYFINQNSSKLNPFLKLYYINSRLLNSDEAYLRIDENGEESFLYGRDGVTIVEKSTSGIGLGGGISYSFRKNQAFLLQIGLERTGDFLVNLADSYPSDTYFIKIGYNISF